MKEAKAAAVAAKGNAARGSSKATTAGGQIPAPAAKLRLRGEFKQLSSADNKKALRLAKETGLSSESKRFSRLSVVHSPRELNFQELMLLSERYNVEIRQVVIKRANGTTDYVIGAGTKYATPRIPILDGDKVLRSSHTHPGHRNVVASGPDKATAAYHGVTETIISRDMDTGELVFGSAQP